MKSGDVRTMMELWFFSMVSVVSAVLPDMRERGAGAILGAFGGNAARGEPYMSGSGPTQAAGRNYLYSMHGELEPEGIRVGLVSINGVIKGSAYADEVDAGASDAPTGLEMPVVDPDEMAEVLWRVANGAGRIETFFPDA